MKHGTVLFVLLSLAGFGADLNGRIEQISGAAIRVRDRGNPITIYTNRDTQVIQGNLASLARGDEIRVDFHMDSSGKRVVADRIYPSTTFSGTVTETGKLVFWMDATRPRAGTRLVRLGRQTVFGSSRNDLIAGAEVLVVGFDLGDGSIDAARVAIYGTDMPVNRL